MKWMRVFTQSPEGKLWDVNSPAIGDVPAEAWPDGELPSQGGGFVETLLPGIDTFLVPATLAQLWEVKPVRDSREKLANGQPNPKFGQDVPRLFLKFTKQAPLIVADGKHKGTPLIGTISGVPRRRGRADDLSAPWISDLAFMLDIGFGNKSRPATPAALQAAINAYAGKTIRIDHGLSAHCRADKVRYIEVQVGTELQTVQDPSGTKGCGDDTKFRQDNPRRKKGRYYTDDFKDPTTGEYSDELVCECGAVLRGFPSIERFVPPL